MIWFRKKQEPVKIDKRFKSKYPIIVQYSAPKGINSAEAGLLFNCRVDPVDVTSLFYQWVNSKLIYINYEKVKSVSDKIKSITLIKKGNMPESYPFYERELFNDIFKDSNSIIIDENTNLGGILSLENLEDYGLKKHWLYREKNHFFWGFLCFFIYVFLLVITFYYLKWFGLIIGIFLAPIMCGFAFKKDNKIRLTEQGSELASHVVGYAKFIEECDEKQLKFFLGEDPLFVDKTLPYAVAFGLETEFLNKVTPFVKDLEKSWLTGDLFSLGNVISFVKSDSLYEHDNGFLFDPLFFLGGGESGNLSYNKSSGFSKGSGFSFGGFSRKGGGGGGGGKSW